MTLCLTQVKLWTTSRHVRDYLNVNLQVKPTSNDIERFRSNDIESLGLGPVEKGNDGGLTDQNRVLTEAV